MTNDQEFVERATLVLGEIARGRDDNGRPLAAETSRQMARHVLSMFHLPWPSGQSRSSPATIERE